MVIELKSEQLRVQFNSFGGALSSIKDAEDWSICGKGMPLIGVDKLLFSSPFVVL